MPIVEVEGQQFEFPEGTSDEVIGNAIRQHFATQDEIAGQVQPAQQIQQQVDQRIAGQPSPPIPAQLTGADRAVVDGRMQIAQEVDQRMQAPTLQQQAQAVGPFEAAAIGAGRGLTTLGRAVGLVEPETPFERRAFEQLKEERPISTTIGEIAGEAAPFIAPGLGVAALPGRAAQFAGAVGLGATEAGLITRGLGEDIGQQFVSAGIGGTVAGALDLALPVIGRIGGKIVRRALGKAPDGAVIDATGKPSQEFLDALQESGQSFDDVVKEAQEELTKKAVEPREAARQAFLKSQGVDPTRAQITRNAADFQAQQEAAKTSSLVRDALEAQEAVLTSRFDNAVLQTGGTASSPTVSVVDALTEKATKLDQEIGDLYKAARQVAPESRNIRFSKLADTLKRMKGADRRAGGNISAIISDMKSKGFLNKKGEAFGRVGVETAEDLRKLTNELYDPANPFGNMLLRQIKDSLDDDVFTAAGRDFFGQARQAKASFEKELARAKISKFDSRKANLVRDLLENKIDPDLMTDKVIFGKGWRHSDLKQLKDYISTDEAGKKAFDDMRAEVMQKIKERAFIGPADEAGFQALSRDKLQKAVETIGRKKLNVLFTPQENKFLRDMLEVARLREPVRGTALGRGPSAQAISRVESAIRQNPIARALLDSVSFDSAGRAVLKSKPTPVKAPAPRLPISPVAGPAAVAALPQQEQQ